MSKNLALLLKIAVILTYSVITDAYFKSRVKRQNSANAAYENLRKQLQDVDSRMFNYVVEYKLDYVAVIEKLEDDPKYDYVFAKEVEGAIVQIRYMQDKLQLVGKFIADHKFNDFDWRHLSVEDPKKLKPKKDVKRNDNLTLLYRFPEPKLLQPDAQIELECNNSAKQCIEYIYNEIKEAGFNNKLPDDQWQDMEEHEKEKHLISPFKTHVQMFQFRATAQYYLCWHSVRQDPALLKFGNKCDSYILPKHVEYEKMAEDSVPFHCALLSFCPDFCYGSQIERGDSNYKSSNDNPCATIRSESCSLDYYENLYFERFITNDVNFTCDCEPGLKFFTPFGVCMDIDECERLAHNCTGPHETCLNTPGGYECVCKRGYRMKYFENEKELIVSHPSDHGRYQQKGKKVKRLCIPHHEITDVEHKIDKINSRYKKEQLLDLYAIIHASL